MVNVGRVNGQRSATVIVGEELAPSNLQVGRIGPGKRSTTIGADMWPTTKPKGRPLITRADTWPLDYRHEAARSGQSVTGRMKGTTSPTLLARGGYIARSMPAIHSRRDGSGSQPAARFGHSVTNAGFGRNGEGLSAQPQLSTVQICRLTRFSSSSWRPETGRGSTSPEATFASSDASDSWPSRIAWPSGPLQPA